MKHYILLSTPIGQMIATSTDEGISQLEFFEGDDVQSNIENFENKQQRGNCSWRKCAFDQVAAGAHRILRWKKERI